MKIVNAKLGCTNQLNRQDQKESILVKFPVTNILQEQGQGGTFTIKMRFPYEAQTTEDVNVPTSEFTLVGNNVEWTVSQTATFYTGYLETQLFYHIGDKIATDEPYSYNSRKHQRTIATNIGGVKCQFKQKYQE